MATCEYELLRQQKIADNRKRMEQLGLQQVIAASGCLETWAVNITASGQSHMMDNLCNLLCTATSCQQLLVVEERSKGIFTEAMM